MRNDYETNDKTLLTANLVNRYLASFGRKPDEEVVIAYALTLRECTEEELRAGFASADISAGTHPLSAGQLAQLCKTERRRLIDEQRQRAAQADERRLYCATCRDEGAVHSWNPWFLAAYKEQFTKAVRSCTLPPTWEGLARSWWRKQRHESGSMTYMVRCNCQCPRAQSYAEQLELHLAGKRKSPPSCGVAIYDPAIAPLKTQNALQDLRQWYDVEPAALIANEGGRR